jgi:hypothetical protein
MIIEAYSELDWGGSHLEDGKTDRNSSNPLILDIQVREVPDELEDQLSRTLQCDDAM